MKKLLSLPIVLALLMLASAAPHDGANPLPPLNPNEARGYAEHLTHVVQLVAGNYVRPIPRGQLYHAALAALYQQAGLPTPASLANDLARVLHELPGEAEEAEPAPRSTTPGDLPVIELVARRRQEIGDLEALRGSGALRLSIDAIIQSLDPYCGLISSEELRRGRGENLNGGFGFTWSPDSTAEELKVATVALGGPAQRAGIRPGDLLTQLRYQPVRLQRQPVPPVGLPGLLNLAQSGDPLECTIQSTGKAVVLYHQLFQAEAVFGVRRHDEGAWCHWLDRDGKIGYVRIGALEHGVADQLGEALTRLEREGMKGLVLDLRWSPGGYLNEAVLITRLFLADGLVATVRCRHQRDDQEYRTSSNDAFADFPLIVLINADTSGGAELIAAALQDAGRARIAGQRSRGKASVQTTYPLPLGDSGMKLTTGQFFRPNGKPLQRQPTSRPADDWGVRPDGDLGLPISQDLSDQLRDEWHLLTLRPGDSKQVLFLDDLDNDPQLSLALQASLQ